MTQEASGNQGKKVDRGVTLKKARTVAARVLAISLCAVALAAIALAHADAVRAARSAEALSAMDVSRSGGDLANSSADAAIRGVLEAQVAAWNRGDVDTFMTGYWKSDQTEFVGAGGRVRGWDSVLARYRKNYPDAKAMGRLTFSNLEVHVECVDAAYAIGEFSLQREKDAPAGVFTLNFRKFAEGWRIVADHSTAFAPRPSE